MTDRIRQRIDSLETQHRDLTARLNEARQTVSDASAMLLTIEGALAVLRDLLVPEEVKVPVGEEIKVAENDG